MKYIFYSIAVSAMLVSCSGSKKGAWSDEDKKKLNGEVKLFEFVFEKYGDKKQVIIDCILEKIEDNYDNFDAANKDEKGSSKLIDDCVKEAM